MAKHFPKFLFSNPKNPDASGPVLFHLNYPRCVFTLSPGIESVKVNSYLLDTKADEEKILSMEKEAADFMKQTLGDLMPFVIERTNYFKSESNF